MNNALVGEVAVFPKERKVFLKKEQLLKVLRGKIKSQLLLQLDAWSSEYLPVGEINIEGLNIFFDEERLVLKIEIVPVARETNVIFFRAPPELAGRKIIHRPESLSGYLNIRATESWDHPDSSGSYSEGPVIADVEGVLNIKELVLESDWDFNASSVNSWRRGDLRLTWDDQPSVMRYQAGDITFGILGFQNFKTLGGISIAKNYAIQPYLVTSPVGRNQIFLNRRSTVKVFVNGRFFRKLELEAGAHDLRELPLVRGVNQVEIEIEDDVGRKERLSFPFVSEAELLRKGLHQYAYNLGAPYAEVGGGRDYETSRPTFSAFHRYGILDSLTLGLYGQGDKDQTLFGSEIIYGSAFGLVAFDLAFSQLDDFATDYAGRLRYRYLQDLKASESSKSFALSVESFGQSFAALGTTQPNNNFSSNVDVSYSQEIWRRLRAGLSYRYQFARQGQSTSVDDRSLASVNFNYSGLSGHQFSLDFTRAIEGVGIEDSQVFFNWLWTGKNPHNFLLSTYDSDTHKAASEYQHSGYIDNSQFNAAVSVSHSAADSSVGAEFDYIGKKVIFLANHSRTGETLESSVTIGTSLAFVGSKWTLSRPISDSFAILAAKPHLHGQRIPINPQGAYFEAEIAGSETAILPSLSSYHYEPVNLDTSRLAPGFQLGEENFVVFPTFKSGIAVTVGTDATIFVTGKLVDRKGHPLTLLAGEIWPSKSISENTSKNTSENATGELKLMEPIVFFTNRKGDFRVEGLNPGRFKIRLFDDSWQDFELVIPEGEAGIISVGTLTLVRK